MERYSKQKEAILEELRSRRDHPTAQDIFFSLKKSMPALSLATVYRNLSALADKGKIIRLQTCGAERFDFDTSQHYHFFCTRCGTVFDIFNYSIFLNSFDVDENIGKVDYHRLSFYGVCRDCIKNTSQYSE